MTWFILALASVVFLAIAELSHQYVLNRSTTLTPRTASVLAYTLQSLLISPFIFIFARDEMFSVFNSKTLPLLLLVTFVGSFATIAYSQSFKVKNISLSSIFISLSVVISTFLGIYFYNESIDPMKFIGIGLILAAIISLNLNNIHLEKNHFYGLIAGILFGVTYFLDKGIVQTINPFVYIFWSFIFLGCFCFIFNPKEVLNSLRQQSISNLKFFPLDSFGYLSYNALTFMAYRLGGEVGRVDAINNSQIFLIILFEYFILKHHDSIFRKIVTAMVACIGIYILGFY